MKNFYMGLAIIAMMCLISTPVFSGVDGDEVLIEHYQNDIIWNSETVTIGPDIEFTHGVYFWIFIIYGYNVDISDQGIQIDFFTNGWQNFTFAGPSQGLGIDDLNDASGRELVGITNVDTNIITWDMDMFSYSEDGIRFNWADMTIWHDSYFYADFVFAEPQNLPPTFEPSGSGVYEYLTPVVLGGQVADPEGDLVSYEWLEGETVLFSGYTQTALDGEPVELDENTLYDLAIGEYLLTLAVNDGINPAVTTDVSIEIVDTTPPTMAPVSDTDLLWPPNHKMVEVNIAVNASDNSGEPVILSVEVASNEPANGNGDGNHSPDWTVPSVDQENGIVTLGLRAERSGNKEDRIYTIKITGTDAYGNVTETDVEVLVPHNKKK